MGWKKPSKVENWQRRARGAAAGGGGGGGMGLVPRHLGLSDLCSYLLLLLLLLLLCWRKLPVREHRL